MIDPFGVPISAGGADLKVLFLSAFISSTLAPGGSEPLLSWFLLQGRTPAWQLWASATLGNTSGAMATWLLGSLIARGWSVVDRSHLSHRALAWLRRFGLPALLLSWLPLIGDGLCLAAGWMRLPWLWGLILIAVGKGLRYGALVWWLG